MTVVFGSNPSDDYQAFLWQAYYAEQERRRQEGIAIAQELERQAQAAASGNVAAQTAQAQQAGTAPTPPPSGPTGAENLASLNAVLPSGFEQSYAPSSLVSPYVEQGYTGARSKADEFLNNMLKRGTITEAGKAAGVSALESQAPAIRSRFSDIGNLLLEQERAGLRGIRSSGEAAAGAGGTFDPSTYGTQAQQSLAQFASSLPSDYASRTGDIAFTTSGLGAATGAVQSPQEILADPYASSVSSGDQSAYAGEDTPAKKRQTAIF